MIKEGRQGNNFSRVFTTFRILEISYISNVFLGFVCHSKMAPISRNYTKFFLPFFYANLYKIPGILRNSVTFYTNFSTIHHIRHILHTAEKLRTPLNTPPPPTGSLGKKRRRVSTGEPEF